MDINIPNTRVFKSDYTGQTDTYAGYVTEQSIDSRSPIRKSSRVGGWRPPLPYSRNFESNAHTLSITSHMQQTSWWGKATDDFSGGDWCSGYWYTPLPPFPGKLVTRCEIGARLNLKNESLNIATNLGERAQTAELVASSCKRLHDAVVAARRLDPRGISKALGLTRKQIRKGSPFDMFLEAQYGWKPMLGDIHSAVQKLSDRENGDYPPIVTVIKTGTERDSFTRTLSSDSSGAIGNVYVTKLHEVVHRCKVRLDFTPANDMLRTATQLGLTNPLELGWELLPFSFVADWFLPIGDYFSQLDATLGYDFKGGSISQKTTMRSSVGGTSVSFPSYPQEKQGYAYSQGRNGYQMAFSRNVYNSCPLPLPNLSLKTKSSGQHVANGIALLTSAFTKKVK